jgi:hypothetical protein
MSRIARRGIVPVNQITPLTYRDGVTYIQMLTELSEYVKSILHPSLQHTVDELVSDVEAQMDQHHDQYVDGVQEFQRIHDAFMSDVNARLIALNDGAVSDLVRDDTSLLGQVLREIFPTSEQFQEFQESTTAQNTLFQNTITTTVQEFQNDTTTKLQEHRDVVSKDIDRIDAQGISPMFYGAVGDGVVDDTEAIRKTVNDGRPVFWGEHTYRMTKPVLIDVSTIRWHSNGAKIMFESPTETEYAFRIEMVNGNMVTTGSLTIDGGMSTPSVLNLYCDTYAHVTLQDIHAQNTYRGLASTTNDASLEIRGGFTQLNIKNCSVRNARCASTNDVVESRGVTGIDIRGIDHEIHPKNVVLDGVTIEDVGTTNPMFLLPGAVHTTNQDGVRLNAAEDHPDFTAPYNTHFVVTNCTFVNCSGRAVKSQGEWTTVSNTLIVRDQKQAQGQIDVDFQVGGGMVSNVNFMYNGSAPLYTIQMRSASDARISGKRIPGSSVNGVHVLNNYSGQWSRAIIDVVFRSTQKTSFAINNVIAEGSAIEWFMRFAGIQDGVHHVNVSNVIAGLTQGFMSLRWPGWAGSVNIVNAVNPTRAVRGVVNYESDTTSVVVNTAHMYGFR